MDDWSANRTLLSRDLTPSTSLSSLLGWLLASLNSVGKQFFGGLRIIALFVTRKLNVVVSSGPV